MQLPFSLDEFLRAFRAYNDAIGPMPLVLTVVAVSLVALAHSQIPSRHRLITAGLAAMWLWSGVVYQWSYFAPINPAARIFGAFFVAQAVLLIAIGTLGRRLEFSARPSDATVAGWLLVVYALVVYPLAGWAFGHGYPNGPSFGAPCPMTIYFVGMLLWTTGRVPLALVVIPVLWSIVGTSAAVQLGITEDFGLAVSAVLLAAYYWKRRSRANRYSYRNALIGSTRDARIAGTKPAASATSTINAIAEANTTGS